MESTKFVGMDVHKDAIAVMNSAGKVVMESILETKAVTILQFIHGLRGDVFVTFEEGTWAAWLYDLLKPHVTKVVVCNPNAIKLALERREDHRISVYLPRSQSDEKYFRPLPYSWGRELTRQTHSQVHSARV